MASMAGQPEYVGVMVTWTAGTIPPSSVAAWTLRRIPRSSMVRTGISGSQTVAARSQAFCSGVFCSAACPRRPWGG